MATPVTNFGKVTVSSGYGSGDVSIALTAGHGSRLPSTFPFPLTWWNVTDYPDPADDPNREIVTVTARSTDTLTVTRGAEGISASTKNTGGKTYKMLLGITAAMLTDIFNLSLSQDFRGLSLQTHPDADVSMKKAQLIHADAIVMSDGEEVATWDDLVVDITAATGIGGLDTGTEQASTWYEIYAAYNGTTKGLFLHRAKNYFLDESQTTDDNNYIVRRSTGNANLRVSQGFKVDTAGPIEFVDVKLEKTGTPAGGTPAYWFTIQANSGGVPSDTPLATSDKLDATRLTVGTATWIRIPFRTPYSVSAATTYHLVMHGDYTASDTNNVKWHADVTAAAYANGSAAWSTSASSGGWTSVAADDFCFKIYVTENDVAVSSTAPAGYRYARIGWVYNNGSSHFNHFTQHNRLVGCGGFDTNWKITDLASTSPVLLDAFAYVPPVPLTVHLNVLVGAVVTIGLGGLDVTDVSSGTGSCVGQVQATGGGANYDALFPPLVLSEYQGLMAADSSSTNSIFVAAFSW